MVLLALHSWRKRIAEDRCCLGTGLKTPQSPLGKALFYAQQRKVELMRYATDGRLDIDNNAVERAIRPVAIGRKNWLFAGSDRGGEAAAAFFTLIASAKRHGLNPYEYLRDIFMRLAARKTPDLDELLPDRWKPKSPILYPTNLTPEL